MVLGKLKRGSGKAGRGRFVDVPARIESETSLLNVAAQHARPKKSEWCETGCINDCERFVSRSSAASLLSSEWMLRAAAANSTLLEYLYPRQPRFEPSTALTSSWQPLTLGCAPVLPHPFGPSCWCFLGQA